MKNVVSLSRFGLVGLLALTGPGMAQNDPVNAELVGQWDDFGGTYADVWGDGDYAYVAHFNHHGVHIVNISDPQNPVAIEYLLPPPNDNGSAQDVKVADGLMFIGIEGGEQSAHVVDVRDPTKPLPLVSIDIDGYRSIHNLFYDSGYLYLADSNSNRVGIVDLTTLDPDDPPQGPITTAKWIIEDVGKSRVHDVTVAGGRLYASAWDSGLWIYDVTNVATGMPTFLGQTPDGGENTHSCWPTANGDYVVTGEERSGGGIKVYRIADAGLTVNLQLTDELSLSGEETFSVHNQVIDGYRLYNSWYGAGLQVLDIDPGTGLLEFVASYDTSTSQGGAWGVYPLLGAGRVLVSDMGHGLFIVSVDSVLGDLNGDGMVGVADLLILFAEWGPCADCGDCPADLNGDCTVGVGDLLILFANWG